MKHLTVILGLAILPAISFAQSNYKPGYAINVKGDTIKGFIDYRDWNENPVSIAFKTNTAEKRSRLLTVGDINSFVVTGLDAYQAYNGPVSMDATDVNHINNSRDTSFKTESVFLKVLQRSDRVSFFQYTDDLKTRFFIQESGGEITELIYRVYNAYDNPTTNTGYHPVTENGYFRQLYVIADKYHLLDQRMRVDVERADYYKGNLLRIISRINGISKADYEKEYGDANLFGSLGVNVTFIKPYGNYANGKSVTSMGPVASFGVGFYTNRNTQKLEFLIQAVVSGSSYTSSYIYTGSPYIPVKYYYKEICFAGAPQFLYSFYSEPGLKLFAGAGIALTYHDYYGAKGDISYAASQQPGVALPSSGFFNTFSYPLLIKAGARIGPKIEILATYYTPCKVTQDHFFQLNASNIQIGLGYKFK